jgi:hypothetical protein
MYSVHGVDFFNNFLGYHIMSRMSEGVEQNIQGLGSVYYINQLLVISSAAAAPAILILRSIPANRHAILYLTALVAPLVIFSISKTKLEHYSIIMLPALALMAGQGLEKLWNNGKEKKLIFALAALLGYWSWSQHLRDTVEAALRTMSFGGEAILILAGGIIIIIGGYFLAGILSGRWTAIIISAFILLRFPFVYIPPDFDTKIGQISEKYERHGCRRMIYIDSACGSDVVNPQIYWYFDSLSPGINPGKMTEYITNAEEIIPLDTADLQGKLILRTKFAEKNISPAAIEYMDARASEIIAGDYYRAWFFCGGVSSR